MSDGAAAGLMRHPDLHLVSLNTRAIQQCREELWQQFRRQLISLATLHLEHRALQKLIEPCARIHSGTAGANLAKLQARTERLDMRCTQLRAVTTSRTDDCRAGAIAKQSRGGVIAVLQPDRNAFAGNDQHRAIAT